MARFKKIAAYLKDGAWVPEELVQFTAEEEAQADLDEQNEAIRIEEKSKKKIEDCRDTAFRKLTLEYADKLLCCEKEDNELKQEYFKKKSVLMFANSIDEIEMIIPNCKEA